MIRAVADARRAVRAAGRRIRDGSDHRGMGHQAAREPDRLTMTRAPSSKVGLSVVTAMVATLLVLGAIELYCRATYRVGWYSQPDFPPGHFPRLNADGLRDVDYGPKPPATYRLMVLGDSYTFGTGVEDDAAIWPAILERDLGAMHPLAGVSTYEVLNAGIAGSLTDQWVGVYRQQRERFRPDLVLVVFFLRDGTQLERSSTEVVAAEKRRIAEDRLARVSTAYRYFLEKRAAIDIGGKLSAFLVESYVGPPGRTAEWRRAQHNLLELRDGAASDGSRFGLATFPVLYGLDRDPYPFQPVMDTLESFCRANGIAYLSLLPAFRGRRASELWVSDVNQHPNAEGHAIAAAALLPFVRQLMEAS